MNFTKKRFCRIRSFTRDSNGGMILEASLILPIYLSFCLALIAFVSIISSELAFRHTLSETTKVVAAHMYPFDLYIEDSRTSPYVQSVAEWMSKMSDTRDKLLAAESWADEYSAVIPKPLLGWIAMERQIGEGVEDKLHEQALQALQTALMPLIAFHTDNVPGGKKKLRLNNFRLTGAEIPYVTGNVEYFGLEAEYTVHLHLPFIRKQIVLRNRSYERVWTGI